ncbi:MAG: hypothetical protein IJG67_01865 [Oscillospiraceae bacterium]|nr:hypothetical protein [Oscillospiraceae bacterium]
MAGKVYTSQEPNGMTKYFDSGGNVLGYTYKDADGLIRTLDKNMKDTGDRSFLDPSTGMVKTVDHAGDLKGYTYRDSDGIVRTTIKKDSDTASSGAARSDGGLFSEKKKEESTGSGSIFDAFSSGNSGREARTSSSVSSGTNKDSLYSQTYAEMMRQADADIERRRQEVSKLKRQDYDFDHPSRSELIRFRPAENCTADSAAEFMRYTAYLLYKNGNMPESYLPEKYKRTDYEKRGPFGLFRKRHTTEIDLPVERYWRLRDYGDGTTNMNASVEEFEDHTYVCLCPDGKVKERTTEEKVLRSAAYLYGGFLCLETGYREISVASDPAGYVSLANYLLYSKKIDMSYDRFIRSRSSISFDDSHVVKLNEALKKEREEQKKPIITDERTLSDIHWTAGIFFLLALLTSKVLPGWIPYALSGTVFWVAYRLLADYELGFRPLQQRPGFEVLVIAMTAFTVFIKTRLNRWLYHDYYDLRMPVMFLWCVAGTMLFSAVMKLFGEKSDKKNSASAGPAAVLVKAGLTIALLGAAAIRLWSMRTDLYDPARYSVVMLLIEAGCIIMDTDWKISLGSYLLYGIFNYKDELWFFKPSNWGSYFRPVSPVVGVVASAIIAGLVTIYVVFKGIKARSADKK